MKRLLEGISDKEARLQFLAGVRDSLPIYLGIGPFAIIVGLTGVEFGLTPLEITLMSAIVYAGVAQLAAIYLMAEGSHIALVVLTVVMINTRLSMYSASLAPYFQSNSRLRRAMYSFIISDPSYALSIPRFRNTEEDHSHWYYFGNGISVWVIWVLGNAIGAGIGLEVPDTFPIELVLPLVLIGVLLPLVEDRPSAATAVVASGVAIAAAPLAYNLDLLLGVFSGLLVGVYLSR